VLTVTSLNPDALLNALGAGAFHPCCSLGT
jgi:hypothetical protein